MTSAIIRQEKRKVRIERHNADEFGSMRYTHKQKGFWRLIFSEEYATCGEAFKKEKFI